MVKINIIRFPPGDMDQVETTHFHATPGGSDGSIKRLRLDKRFWRCLAHGGVWVLPGSLEPVFAKRCEWGAKRFQVQNWTARRILHGFGWRSWCDALLGTQLWV